METQNSPMIVAEQVQNELGHISQFGAEKEAIILRQMKPETLVAIRRATPSELLPIELDIEFTELVYQVVGEQGLFDWQREQTTKSMSGPLLGPVVHGIAIVLGVKSVFKHIPRGWHRMFKNCGAIALLDTGPKQLQLVLTNLASQICNSHAYLVGLCGGFDAVLSIARAKGKVRLLSNVLLDRKAVFQAEWQ